MKLVLQLGWMKEDAEAILKEMREMDKEMRHEGSRVVPVALNKIFQLKADGISFRFIPESSQVVKAIKEKAKAGENAGGFNGVPVFQVGVFEEILKTMVEGSTSKWDDVVFVPPGFKMPAYQN
ncbi:Protein TIC 22-like [Carex littledalei]|uniref:Protein TIC 22-like n=1 Tax=Carex littledalei TaxID=544730 RepID=A0A833RAF4_9POAL|nr:Protein TIC 22-like [Carex littledalei]